MVPSHAIMLFVSPIVWITVIIALVTVFGATRLPEITHSVGKSAKALKEELRGLAEDGSPAAPVSPEANQVQAPAQAAPKPKNPTDQGIPHQDN